MNPVDMARMAVSGLGPAGGGDDSPAPAPQEHGTVEHLGREGNSFLDQIMNRRAGVTEGKQSPADDSTKRELEDLRKKLEDAETRARSYGDNKEVLTGMLKNIEQLAQRPVTVQMPQQQQGQQQNLIPDLPEIDDPELMAAIRTLDKRYEQKLAQISGQLVGSINGAHNGVELSNFENALYAIKAAHPDWQIDENAVRNEVTRGIQDRRFVGVNWRRELELAYTAQTAPQVSKELAELRKFKAEVEAKQKADQDRQRKNLSQVPSIGGRAGSSSGGGLVADGILADARKNGKRLSWSEFGRQYKQRSRA